MLEDETIDIEKIVAGGDGMGRLKNGKIIFIPYTAPGETVSVTCVSEKKGFYQALPEKILKSSPERRNPPCLYYYQCGGCNLQHIRYGEQLRIKKDLVTDIFTRTAKTGLPGFDIVPSPSEFHYKNRMQFHNDKYGKYGLKRKRGSEIIPIENCMLAVPEINTCHIQIPADFDKISLFGYGNHLYTDSAEDDITIEVLDKTITTGPALFFQTNLALLPELVRFAVGGLRGENVLDLYCGVGLFSAFLQENFYRGTGIEITSAAECYFRKNTNERFRFIGSSAEKSVSFLSSDEWDAAVIDPPRAGMSPYVRNVLASKKVKDLVYVSCDPVTQARDIRVFLEKGYELKEIKLFDFYPQTAHIESVVKLKYNGPC